jgi:hypothetical protein
LQKRRGISDEWRIRRDLLSLKYSLEQPKIWDPTVADAVARSLIAKLPYILFFDDFRDKIEEKIEIVDAAKASGWLEIIEQLFRQTDPSLSVYTLPTLEERQRKTVLAKVRRKLNETLTREWQNFRLDERDALDISIDFTSEGVTGSVRNYIKLDVVETDIAGDQHFFFISNRSKGFYWFFNFVMKLEFNPKLVAGGDSTVYLLDEPGSYLHAFAQRKLCNKLKQLSVRNRVIYCTHSQYLLDPEIVPISSVSVADKDGNGVISLVPIFEYKGGANERRSALQPMWDALQIKPFALDALDAKMTVIVEGMYDYFALELFRGGRRVAIMPSVGADSVKFFVSLLIGWRLDFRALWDNDPEGQKKFAEAKELFSETVADKYFRLLPSTSGRRKIMQDLFNGDDLTMIRNELSLPSNCSFERTLHALFYSDLRAEIVQRFSSQTRTSFQELYEALLLT